MHGEVGRNSGGGETKNTINLSINKSANQVPCSLAQTIMIFRASLSLVAFSASVTLPTLSYFVSPYNMFSCCFPLLCFPSIIQVVTGYSSFYLLITWPKRLSGNYVFYFRVILLYQLHWFQQNLWHVLSNKMLCSFATRILFVWFDLWVYFTFCWKVVGA